MSRRETASSEEVNGWKSLEKLLHGKARLYSWQRCSSSRILRPAYKQRMVALVLEALSQQRPASAFASESVTLFLKELLFWYSSSSSISGKFGLVMARSGPFAAVPVDLYSISGLRWKRALVCSSFELVFYLSIHTISRSAIARKGKNRRKCLLWKCQAEVPRLILTFLEPAWSLVDKLVHFD